MKTAIISDLHANLEAVEATLADIDQQSVDQILCLGDLVGYFANPNECISLIQSRAIRTITGNHDRVAAGLKEPDEFGEAARRAILWTRTQLSPAGRAFLEALPLTLDLEGKILLVHGALTPHPNEDLHLSSLARAEQSLAALQAGFSARVCLFGHTHRPMIYRHHAGTTEQHKGAPGEIIELQPDAHYLINPGSVGQPRDGDPRASYLLMDGSTIQFRRVPFARERALAKAERAGLLHHESALRRARHRVADVARRTREELRRIYMKLRG